MNSKCCLGSWTAEPHQAAVDGYCLMLIQRPCWRCSCHDVTLFMFDTVVCVMKVPGPIHSYNTGVSLTPTRCGQLSPGKEEVEELNSVSISSCHRFFPAVPINRRPSMEASHSAAHPPDSRSVGKGDRRTGWT